MISRESEGKYYLKEYKKILPSSDSMKQFLAEVFTIVSSVVDFKKDSSFLDFGCGRGYFLNYLYSIGYSDLQGVDPCEDLINAKLFDNIQNGSYEKNACADNSFDVVFTCHTLHHLKDPSPIYAIKEMARISKKYVVIIEINNTNIPMWIVSLLNYRFEKNAYKYNIKKVKQLVRQSNLEIIKSLNMEALYVSGNSFLHKILYKIGQRPYNITIAEKKSSSF